jgi:hypothetical protein
MWLVLTLLSFGHTEWTGRAILVLAFYVVLGCSIAWSKNRTLLPPPLPEDPEDKTSRTSQCTTCTSDLLQITMLRFDKVCIPVLISGMVVASTVPFTALGLTGFTFGFGCSCVAISPLFFWGCQPRHGWCWQWCFCCKRCQHCRDTPGSSNNSSSSNRTADTHFVQMSVKDHKDDDGVVSIAERILPSDSNHNNSNRHNSSKDNNNGDKDNDSLLPSSNSLSKVLHQNLRHLSKSIVVGQIVTLFFAWSVVFTTSGSCIAFFAPSMPGIKLGPITWSSSFTRSIFGRTNVHDCDWEHERYCHLYLTVPSFNASSSLIVTAHTKITDSNEQVQFALCPLSKTTMSSESSAEASDSKCAEPPTYHSASSEVVDWMPDRHREVHSAYLSMLHRETFYALWVVRFPTTDSSALSPTPDLTFETFPLESTPLQFIVGGDMGTTPAAQQVSEQAAAQQISFAIIGGDISYANDLIACIDVWDEWLSIYEKVMVTKKGAHIPMITTVGNHDVGSNAGSKSNQLRFSDESGKGNSRTWNTPAVPYAFAFFPHDVVETTGSVVPMHQRRPFHLHQLIGELNIYNLDSGHVVQYEDTEQMALFNQSGNNNNNNNKNNICNIAVYHVPIFPAGDYSWDAANDFMVDPRKYWLPEFERIGIHAAFEHHVHLLKTTIPLGDKNTTALDKKTTYFGDGRWGITGGDDMTSIQSPKTEDGKPLFEGLIENHVWLIKIQDSVMNVRAVGKTGDLGSKWERTINC